MKLYRQHPASLIEGVWKNIFLLAFPLLRGLLALSFDVYKWVSGAWLDILILIVIITYAVLRMKSRYFYIEKENLYVKSGIFFRNHFTIPPSEITTVYFSQNPFHKALCATRVIIETNAGAKTKGDFSIILSRKNALALEESINKFSFGVIKKCYQPKTHFVLLYSIQSTSTLSGILLLSAFFSQAGAILGRQIRDEVINTISDISKNFIIKIPPIAVSISIVLIMSFVVGFVFNVIRYMKFIVRRSKASIIIDKGILVRQRYYITPQKIIFIERRQSMLTKLLKISSVFISSAGFGKSKGESAVIFPAVTNKQADKTLRLILPEFQFDKITIKPPKSSVFSYVFLPIMLCAVLSIALIFAKNIKFHSADVISFALIIMLIPFLWLIVVRLVASFMVGVSINDDNVTVSFVKGFSFRKICTKKEKIIKAKIFTNPFNKISKKCTLILYLAGEKAVNLRVIGMKTCDAEKIIENII